MTETNTEWSAVKFINRTITSENGFTVTLIDAVEEIINQAENAQSLLKENARLCAALEFYADEATYDQVLYDESGHLEGSLAEMDLRHRARQALDGNPYEH